MLTFLLVVFFANEQEDTSIERGGKLSMVTFLSLFIPVRLEATGVSSFVLIWSVWLLFSALLDAQNGEIAAAHLSTVQRS